MSEEDAVFWEALESYETVIGDAERVLTRAARTRATPPPQNRPTQDAHGTGAREPQGRTARPSSQQGGGAHPARTPSRTTASASTKTSPPTSKPPWRSLRGTTPPRDLRRAPPPPPPPPAPMMTRSTAPPTRRRVLGLVLRLLARRANERTARRAWKRWCRCIVQHHPPGPQYATYSANVAERVNALNVDRHRASLLSRKQDETIALLQARANNAGKISSRGRCIVSNPPPSLSLAQAGREHAATVSAVHAREVRELKLALGRYRARESSSRRAAQTPPSYGYATPSRTPPIGSPSRPPDSPYLSGETATIQSFLAAVDAHQQRVAEDLARYGQQ